MNTRQETLDRWTSDDRFWAGGIMTNGEDKRELGGSP
jgi:hypothetical protein